MKPKKKRWLLISVAVLLVLLAAGGVYSYSVYQSMQNAVVKMHKPVERQQSAKRSVPVRLTRKDPFSVLLLGVDQRKGDKGRSDTVIVLAVNPNTNSVKMLSIPRDTRTEIVGKGKLDKINHAYAYGDIPMAMNTVEKFLDIPIDYYVEINMQGFKQIVDAVGGVTIQNELDFSYGGVHFSKGTVHLNGRRALFYTRMRKDDPRGDFGRQIRQQKIIQAVINKGTSFSSLTHYKNIFAALGNNVHTNLSFGEMVDIQRNYKGTHAHIQQLQMSATGTRINGIYYLIVSPEEKQKIQNQLKAQLELKN
jgi:LCP family protein required for cell wall assembly